MKKMLMLLMLSSCKNSFSISNSSNTNHKISSRTNCWTCNCKAIKKEGGFNIKLDNTSKFIVTSMSINKIIVTRTTTKVIILQETVSNPF